MFTGIIEQVGSITKVLPVRGNRIFWIKSDLRVKVRESISVNGTCLTVTNTTGNLFAVEVIADTLKKTNLNYLRVGDKVNLERPLTVGDRLSGHFVTGHIDEVGKILSLRKLPGQTLMEISVNPKNLIYLVKKGSVAVEGVSLTIQELGKRSFWVTLIPYTLKETTLSRKKRGDPVNIEYDLLAKQMVNLSR